MEYRSFMNAAPSLLGFGCMRFVTDAEGHVDEKAAEALVDRAYAAGVNYYDTAYRYLGGESETFIGKALSKYPRESFYLATKMPNWMVNEPADVERIFSDQLERCRVDYFDFYLIHALSKDSWEKMEQLGVYDILAKYKAEGKIKRLGFSFHDAPEVLETICAAHPFDFAQIQLNYLDWEHQRAREQYEILEKYGMGCIVMEPVRGGLLATLNRQVGEMLLEKAPDKSLASWAIRFAAGLPNVITVLSGMNAVEQLDDNVKTMTNFQPLSAEEKACLGAALHEFQTFKVIRCTGCKYCLEQCPQQIRIPDIIAQLNDLAFNNTHKQCKDFITALEVKPSACISCGACAEICPQHIDIPGDVLPKAAKWEN